MQVRNNYDECLTNLACSIRKYFNLEYNHKTIDYIDKILEERNPKNVIIILFDGMGSNILKRALPENAFFLNNMAKTITSVFPATTVAATTSITTGLNPVETAMLGWNSYYKDLDKVITTFFDSEKGDKSGVSLPEAKEYRESHMITKTITSEINEKGEYKGYYISPFGDIKYKNLDEMLSKIADYCKTPDKKYIYAYDPEPDHTMHDFGPDSIEARALIHERNDKVEKICSQLKDTLVIVIADHGHIKVDNLFLKDYPEIHNCLIRNTSIESRAVNFFVKNEEKSKFCALFNKEFGQYFDLYTREDVIESKLFGDGKENPIFRDLLGDYIAIAKSDKTILLDGDNILYSQHAGYTDDEIYIPLIVIER